MGRYARRPTSAAFRPSSRSSPPASAIAPNFASRRSNRSRVLSRTSRSFVSPSGEPSFSETIALVVSRRSSRWVLSSRPTVVWLTTTPWVSSSHAAIWRLLCRSPESRSTSAMSRSGTPPLPSLSLAMVRSGALWSAVQVERAGAHQRCDGSSAPFAAPYRGAAGPGILGLFGHSFRPQPSARRSPVGAKRRRLETCPRHSPPPSPSWSRRSHASPRRRPFGSLRLTLGTSSSPRSPPTTPSFCAGCPSYDACGSLTSCSPPWRTSSAPTTWCSPTTVALPASATLAFSNPR